MEQNELEKQLKEEAKKVKSKVVFRTVGYNKIKDK